MQYIRVSDVVHELSVARQDDDRVEFIRYMILSKSILRDLKVKYINDFKRVYVNIDPKTMTARIPLDSMRVRTVSVIEKCKDRWGQDTEKVIPLTTNPYINITPVPSKNGCSICGCEPTHPVCVELDAYTTLCEDVTLDDGSTGTKQTVLKTCANGDIISEVTQPTLKFKKDTQQCDYSIDMEVMRETVCDYTLAITVSLVAGTNNIRLIKNGFNVDSGALAAGYTATNNFFHSIGWTVTSNGHYTLNNSTDVYDYTVIVTDALNVDHTFTLTRNCKEDNILDFPYYITSYVVNNTTVTESPLVEISTQADLDAFFDGLGFTKVDDTHYTLSGSTDVYYTITIEPITSPATSPTEFFTLYFNQTNCYQPLVSDGIENVITTDVLCNVEVKDCGCIVESESNIETIVSCCGSFLNCCQEGQLNNWSGWGFVPSCCPTNTQMPYNMKGTFKLDEQNFLIYLDNVNATKVLLAYDTDGSCEGDFAFPNYCLEAFKAGLAYRHAQYNEDISMPRRRELKMNYDEELTALSKTYIDPIRMSDLVGALKTKLTPM